MTENHTERLNKFTLASFENIWALLLRECGKRREKKTQILTSQKTFMKTDVAPQTKHQLRHKISRKCIFELQGFGWDLSMIRLN